MIVQVLLNSGELYHGYKESCSLVCVGGFTPGSVRESQVINLHGVGVGQRDSGRGLAVKLRVKCGPDMHDKQAWYS